MGVFDRTGLGLLSKTEVKWTVLTGLHRTTVENGCKMDVFDFGGGVVFLWWCGFVVVFLRCCFCGGGVVVFLWWCCGGAFVCGVFVVALLCVVFLWWCGGVFVRAVCVRRGVFVVVLWWCFCVSCFCGGVVVVRWCFCACCLCASWCFCGGVVVVLLCVVFLWWCGGVRKDCPKFCRSDCCL